jgi:hypothetical protein
MVCKLTVKIQTKKYGYRNAKTRYDNKMQNRSAKKKRALNAARLVDMYLIIKDF